jgi:hypothetical protein
MDPNNEHSGAAPDLNWSSLNSADKREVFRLAGLGERHPSPQVAEAAAAWANRDALNKWWNRAPGWLLPLLGVVVLAVGVAGDLIVLVVGGALVVVSGLLGWNTKRCSDLLRRTYGD